MFACGRTPNGGQATYAIRVRDAAGAIKRETFSIWSSWRSERKAIDILQNDGKIISIGTFLEDARDWARDRINSIKGKKSKAEFRWERAGRISAALQVLTLEQMAERAFKKLERAHRNDAYTIQVRKLFYTISHERRRATLMGTNVRKLASEIASHDLPVFQSRALQSFVGQLFSTLSRWHGPAGRVSDSLSERISRLRSRQPVPHPEILVIANQDFAKLFDFLNREIQWKAALAIRLYFATGAKLRRILSAEWRQIIDGTWYPYSPDEREYWFMGRERLNEEAISILEMVRERQSSNDTKSIYIFPREVSAVDRPITTVRRQWIKAALVMKWDGLPLSHVVQRYNERNTPSYTHMYRYLFVPMVRRSIDPALVSKLTNRPDNIDL